MRTIIMATKNKKNPITSILLLVVVLLVIVIAYKQVYLVSKITTALPETALTDSLKKCVQDHANTDMVNDLATKNNIDVASFNWGGLMDKLIDKIPNQVMSIELAKNYLTEVKVTEVGDFVGKNAQIAITGALDIVYSVPVLGDTKEKKNYQLLLIKRDKSYYFKEVSVKKPDQSNWETWACSQTL